ncbi:MAG: hypothetical protein ACM3WU_05385 [Bacillota bacterium]
MDNPEIMSGIKLIPYDKVNIMETVKEETVRALGREKWAEITANIEVPADGMEERRLSHLMREFIRRYEAAVEPKVAQKVLCRVAHGLRRSDFPWARERFLHYNDIDDFCAVMRKETLIGFARAAVTGEDFHGQPVDESVFRFVQEQPHLLYGARDGNAIVAIAIPCETKKYLEATDVKLKRYYACHCQFARESILQEEGPVSKTLCSCSLGHTKVFWEAVLDTSLEGEVLSSVLGGGELCRFMIHLPDKVMEQYVHAPRSAVSRPVKGR